MTTTITVYSLSVKIDFAEVRLKTLVDKFIAKYYTSKGIAITSTTSAEDTEFISRVCNGSVVMHQNQFIHFIHYLKDIGQPLGPVKRIDDTDYEVVMHDYEARVEWAPRDYQQLIIDFIVDKPVKSKMVNLYTGGGKTLVALLALAQVGMRMAICVLPTYMEKWLGEVVKYHVAKTTDVMMVSGSKAVRALIAMAKDNEINAKYFIISTTTMQNYIKDYETDPDKCVLMYGASPFEFMRLVGIGTLLIDETHQHFHAVFKIILYSNVRFQLGLSATLISDDEVVSRAHKIVYTEAQTYTHGELAKYIDVYALAYSIPESLMRKVKTTNFGSNNYSHTAFEGSMLKNKPHDSFYIQLITANLEAMFIDRYEEGDKCIVFVSTVKLASMLTKIYKGLFPHLRVERYCEDDPDENLYESDLIITTPTSAGTAVDVKNLRVVLQTVCVSSSPQNIQNLGRLRKLEGGKDTRFAYLFCENIRKQVQYHKKREELFAPRCASHRTYRAKTVSSFKIGV